MNIHELKTAPIERIENARSDQVAGILSRARRPIIFSGLGKDMEFLRQWNLDFFGKQHEAVPAQKPEADGVNYFVKYFRIPLSDFVARLRAGDSLYIGAREIMKEGGVRSDKDGLGSLYATVKLPQWINPKRIWSSNLWMGAGNNRTLLHYDPWDGVMMLASGKKEFLIFPNDETPRMAQVGAFEFRKLATGAVLHSKIRPLSVQPEYQQKFSRAEGWRGTLSAGEVIYIPAGFWHYVESSGLNIGINFFLHFEDWLLNLHDPLRNYWIMDNITLWPIRWWQVARGMAGKFYHRFVPRKTAA